MAYGFAEWMVRKENAVAQGLRTRSDQPCPRLTRADLLNYLLCYKVVAESLICKPDNWLTSFTKYPDSAAEISSAKVDYLPFMQHLIYQMA